MDARNPRLNWAGSTLIVTRFRTAVFVRLLPPFPSRTASYDLSRLIRKFAQKILLPYRTFRVWRSTLGVLGRTSHDPDDSSK